MHWAKALIRVLVAKAKQGRVHSLGMANLNNLGSLQAVGVVPGCLIPSRGMIKAEYCLLENMGQREKMWL